MMSSNNLEMRSLTRLMKVLALFCFTTVMLASAAVNAIAQTSPATNASTANKPSDTSSQPQAQPKADSTYQPITLGGVTFSGSLRVRLESWDWFDTPAAEGKYTFGAAQLRLSLSQKEIDS
jgi:hypothetical protein